MSKQLILWSAKVCPWAHRARLAVKQKKLDILIKQEDLSNKTADFTQTYKKATFSDPNSDGKVPLLQHGEIIFTQSDLISWYIAETFTEGNSLLPKSTFQIAKVRYFLNQIGSKIPGTYYSYIGYSKNKDKQSEIDKAASNIFEKFNDNIVGPYVLGQQYSLADLMIWPWFDRWIAIEHYTKTEINPKNWPKIEKWIQALNQRQAVKQTSGLNDIYIEGTKKFFASNQ